FVHCGGERPCGLESLVDVGCFLKPFERHVQKSVFLFGGKPLGFLQDSLQGFIDRITHASSLPLLLPRLLPRWWFGLLGGVNLAWTAARIDCFFPLGRLVSIVDALKKAGGRV